MMKNFVGFFERFMLGNGIKIKREKIQLKMQYVIRVMCNNSREIFNL